MFGKLNYRTKCRKYDKIDFGVSSVVDLGISPTAALAEDQDKQLLLAALRALPIEHQILLELYYWEGMRGPELAKYYALPEGTVRTRLRRARQLLSQSFERLAANGTDGDGDGGIESLAAWARELREQLAEDTEDTD